MTETAQSPAVFTGPAVPIMKRTVDSVVERSRVVGDAYDRYIRTADGTEYNGDGTSDPRTVGYDQGIINVAKEYGTTGASIQEAHDDADPGMALLLGARSWDLTDLAGPLDISKSLTLLTAGVTEVITDDSSGGYGPTDAPYLLGTVLKQTLAGADIVRISGAGVNLQIPHGLGLLFDDAISFEDTGHGFNIDPPAKGGSDGYDQGLYGSLIQSLFVFGHDGDHYAFRLLNFLLCTFVNLRGHGGGGMQLEADTTTTYYGNSVFINPYMDLFVGGSAHGYDLVSRGTAGVDLGALVLNEFVRPQCNISNRSIAYKPALPAPSAAQYLWKSDSGTGSPSLSKVESPNLEGYDYNNPVDFGPFFNNGVRVDPGGGTLGTTEITPFMREAPVITGPSFVNGPALGVVEGTRGFVGYLSGNDRTMQLVISVGPDPDVADTILAVIGWESFGPAVTAHITSLANKYANVIDLYITDITDNRDGSPNTLTIRAGQQLAASGQYQILLTIVPRFP